MTEPEKSNLLKYISERGPGKRRVKPTAAVLELRLPEDDEDDEDFLVNEPKEESGSDGSSGSDDEEDGDEDEEEEDKESSSEEDTPDTALEQIELQQDATLGTGTQAEVEKICAVCLNSKSGEGLHLYMNTCDRCGISMHETCYEPETRVMDWGSLSDDADPTEPWFCEPCLFLETVAPFCEFCSSRHGAFKCADIPGCYAHLICALYIPKVTFGDIDHLSGISWQEMDHRIFGRKACNACIDPVEARTGIVVKCDAGMCKVHYHVTCAQRLGLLVPLRDDEADHTGIFYCKKHSDPSAVKSRIKRYNLFHRQEEGRFLFRMKQLTTREEAFRIRIQEQLKNSFVATFSIHGANREMNRGERMMGARNLATSFAAVEAFRNKAEVFEGDSRAMDRRLTQIRAPEVPYLPPAFTAEYMDYARERDNVTIPVERQRLERVNREWELKKAKEMGQLHQLRNLPVEIAEKRQQAKKQYDSIKKIEQLLKATGINVNPLKEYLTECKETVASKVKAPARKSGRKLSTSSHARENVNIPKCAECTEEHDQHLLIQCDCCKEHYHLGCLDPPLERRPKKVNCDWFCTRCVRSSSEETVVVDVDAPRQLRRKSATKRYSDETHHSHSPKTKPKKSASSKSASPAKQSKNKSKTKEKERENVKKAPARSKSSPAKMLKRRVSDRQMKVKSKPEPQVEGFEVSDDEEDEAHSHTPSNGDQDDHVNVPKASKAPRKRRVKKQKGKRAQAQKKKSR